MTHLQELQEKYRVLRKRFKENFVVIGDQPGNSLPYNIHLNNLYWSIPLDFRKVGDDFYKEAAFHADAAHGYGTQEAINAFNTAVGCTNGYVMGFGDTTAELGFYMATLATEYGLLEIQNDNNILYCENLKDEIYYALNALMRMDKRAHDVFGFTSNGHQGYSLRDDADTDLYQTAPKTGSTGTGLLDRDPGAVSSDYVHPNKNGKWNEGVNSLGIFVSQDQIIYLLMGLALLNKLLPDGATSQLSATPLKTLTQDLIRGFIFELENDKWLITAPNGTKNTKAGNMYHSGYGYPVVLMGEQLFNHSPGWGAKNSLWFYWWFFGYFASDANVNNVKMVRMLISLSNVKDLDSNFAHCMRSDSQRDIYPIIQSLLFGESFKPEDQDKLYNDLGETLSQCSNNPARVGTDGGLPNGLESPLGWRTPNRWVHNGVQQLDKPGWQARPSAHNGVDYLLAYNLYHLYFHPDTKYQPYKTPYAPDIIPEFHESADAGCVASNAKDNLYYSDSENILYYRTTDNKLWILYNDQGTWKSKELVVGVSSVGNIIIYQISNKKIFYKGPDNRLYNYYWDWSNHKWAHDCVQYAVSNLTDDFVVSPDSSKIYYRGNDNRMYLLYWESNAWKHIYLRSEINDVSGQLILVKDKIFYRGFNSRLYQFAHDNGGWHRWPTNSDNTVKDNLLYSDAHDKFFYRGTDNKLRMHYYANNAWYSGTVHGSAKNLGNRIMELKGKIVYLNNENKICLVYWNGNNWGWGNLDRKQNNIRNNFVAGEQSGRVYYNGTDNKLYYFYWTGNKWKSICTNHKRKDTVGYLCVSENEDKIFYRTGSNKIMVTEK